MADGTADEMAHGTAAETANDNADRTDVTATWNVWWWVIKG